MGHLIGLGQTLKVRQLCNCDRPEDIFGQIVLTKLDTEEETCKAHTHTGASLKDYTLIYSCNNLFAR